MSKILPLISATLFALSAGLAAQSAAQPSSARAPLNLWPHDVPGAQAAPQAETDTTKPTDYLVAGKPIVRLTNVSVPTLTLYAPKSARPDSSGNSSATIVVFPGGGYNILAFDLEGTEICDWLSARDVACVLVKYRVPGTGPFPKSPAALQDAQRAVGMVRQHAAEWHIDPNRVGVLGFSAGAHLAATLSTHYEQRVYPAQDAADQLSCRPDFQVILYPGYLALPDHGFAPNPDIVPNEKTPPAFLLQAENDHAHIENAVTYFMALKNANVPAELHIYAEGGHGYGLRRTALPITGWPVLVEAWLRTIKVIPAQ